MKKQTSHRGRPAIYTKPLITSLVSFAKAQGVSLKAALVPFEKSRLSATQRKKKFVASLRYVPMLVAAARVGLNLRNLMKTK